MRPILLKGDSGISLPADSILAVSSLVLQELVYACIKSREVITHLHFMNGYLPNAGEDVVLDEVVRLHSQVTELVKCFPVEWLETIDVTKPSPDLNQRTNARSIDGVAYVILDEKGVYAFLYHLVSVEIVLDKFLYVTDFRIPIPQRVLQEMDNSISRFIKFARGITRLSNRQPEFPTEVDRSTMINTPEWAEKIFSAHSFSEAK